MYVGFVAAGAIALMALMITPADVHEECAVADTDTATVTPSATLTWTSAFLCADAPDMGTYIATVTVTNNAASGEAVSLDTLVLTHTSPRPGGRGPNATGSTTGLPTTLAPGASASFDISGDYTLVDTDEGAKANLHVQVSGSGLSTGAPFSIGINVMVRAPGAIEDGGGGDEGNGDGPPSWAPGPPPWVTERITSHAARAPWSWSQQNDCE